jgi:hypothetical protein
MPPLVRTSTHRAFRAPAMRLPEISRAAGPSRSFVGQRDKGDRRLELETFAVPESQGDAVAEKPSWGPSISLRRSIIRTTSPRARTRRPPDAGRRRSRVVRSRRRMLWPSPGARRLRDRSMSDDLDEQRRRLGVAQVEALFGSILIATATASATSVHSTSSSAHSTASRWL